MIEKTYFNQTLKKGKLGEDIAIRYLTAIGYDVESVANDSQYFADDIDLIATTAEHKMKVEVKADYKTH
ncbi:MAG: hypothetical protein KBS91_01030 [Firmicutes bacterium]|nr:hypothetical protein [Candidatus Caballimonas caccae]